MEGIRDGCLVLLSKRGAPKKEEPATFFPLKLFMGKIFEWSPWVLKGVSQKLPQTLLCSPTKSEAKYLALRVWGTWNPLAFAQATTLVAY